MKNNSTIQYILTAILVLIAFGTGTLMATSETIEVPGETVYETVTSIEYVNITTAEIIEVEKDWLQVAIDEFLVSAEDEEDEAGNEVYVLECDNYEYDFEDISVSKVYDKWKMTTDDEFRTIEFEVKLKYDEEDSRSCRESYDVSVLWEENEDTIIKVI